ATENYKLKSIVRNATLRV
ncbi:hypothetical protein pipiens_009787, partial [Culex pipiens pipiens]